MKLEKKHVIEQQETKLNEIGKIYIYNVYVVDRARNN